MRILAIEVVVVESGLVLEGVWVQHGGGRDLSCPSFASSSDSSSCGILESLISSSRTTDDADDNDRFIQRRRCRRRKLCKQ